MCKSTCFEGAPFLEKCVSGAIADNGRKTGDDDDIRQKMMMLWSLTVFQRSCISHVSAMNNLEINIWRLIWTTAQCRYINSGDICKLTVDTLETRIVGLEHNDWRKRKHFYQSYCNTSLHSTILHNVSVYNFTRCSMAVAQMHTVW